MAKFVLSKKRMLEQYAHVKEVCDEVSYSAKTNYEVATLMEQETPCSFCIHSPAELETLSDTSRAWYFAQGWDADELQAVFDTGACRFVVDNERDLALLLENRKEPFDLLLRMRLQERTLHTGKFYVFGMKAATVMCLVKELRSDARIGKLGIHFHRKSQNISEWSLLYELQQLLDDETLQAIDLLDIGGGIPVSYKNFKAKVLDTIFSNIQELRTWLQQHKIKLIIEPGRYIAAPCVKLVAKIKNVVDDAIIVDCSVFNTAMDTFVVHHKLLVEGELEKGTAFTIKGITPTSEDILRYRVYLDNPHIGDELTFLNVGAYNYWTDFCKLPKLETEVVE